MPPLPPASPELSPVPPLPPLAPPDKLSNLIVLLNDAANAKDASTAASYAASLGEVLNGEDAAPGIATHNALNDATEADTRTATRETSLRVLESIVTSKGGATNAGEEALVANGVRALVAVPAEVTSGALLIGARLLEATVQQVLERGLALADDELRHFAMAFEAGLDVASARMHPNETAAEAEAVRLSADVPVEVTSGEDNMTNPFADDPSAPTLASNYARYAPIAEQLA